MMMRKAKLLEEIQELENEMTEKVATIAQLQEELNQLKEELKRKELQCKKLEHPDDKD